MSKKRVLVITGGMHHHWAECCAILRSFLETTDRYALHVTENRSALEAESLAGYDAVIVYAQGGKLTEKQAGGLLSWVREGGPFVGIHTATACCKENAGYIDMVGARFAGHGPVTEFTVTPTGTASPVTRDVQPFRVTDEFYMLDRFDPAANEILATGEWEGETHPMAYTRRYGEGKVFYLALGHDERAFNAPEFQTLLLRGLDWAVGAA